jgi:hypothetical protein
MTANVSAHRLASLRRHLTAWTFQSWLALFFIGAAYAKLTEPAGLLEVLLRWTAFTDAAVVQAVGIAELVVGLGVVAPLLSWRFGRPVMWTSLGLMAVAAVVMTATHLALKDYGLAAVNVVLLGLALVALWLRTRPSDRSRAPATFGAGAATAG